MIHDAELFTVGTDEVVVTFVSEGTVPVTTAVGGHEVATTGPFHYATIGGLAPGTEYELRVEGAESSDVLPASVTTLTAPRGRQLARFGTVNDVHFGETVCGLLGTPEEMGPVFAAEPGAEPYPEVMNRGVIEDLEAGDFDVVLVKGDLTSEGTEAEYQCFLDAYGAFGERMHHVRGNHDANVTDTIANHGPLTITLPGVTLAVLDTVRPRSEKGMIDPQQLVWLDTLAAESSQPVLVFGHHHPWDPASAQRKANYFGINPDDSEALCAVIDRRSSIAGYFAGHTHRNRVRRFAAAREVPIVEVACVKDYPGAWARYDIYEDGYVQTVRRARRPDAMAWAEKTRQMFAGLYRDYALGAIEDRCFTQVF